MSEPEADLLPTVTLKHRYGEQRLLANRQDYIHHKDGRFRNWLLSDNDPEVQPPLCRSATCRFSSAPELSPASAIQHQQGPKRLGKRHLQGRWK